MSRMPTKRQRLAAAKVLRSYVSRVTRLADKATTILERKHLSKEARQDYKQASDWARAIHDAHDFLVIDPEEQLDRFEKFIEQVRTTSNRGSGRLI